MFLDNLQRSIPNMLPFIMFNDSLLDPIQRLMQLIVLLLVIFGIFARRLIMPLFLFISQFRQMLSLAFLTVPDELLVLYLVLGFIYQRLQLVPGLSEVALLLLGFLVVFEHLLSFLVQFLLLLPDVEGLLVVGLLLVLFCHRFVLLYGLILDFLLFL